jgi:hypothetical protein
MQTEISIMTEDDVIVHPGARVYNYYDMWPGTIQPLSDYEVEAALKGGVDIKEGIWFYVKPDDGGPRAQLNGVRICTIEFAQRRGFRGV